MTDVDPTKGADAGLARAAPPARLGSGAPVMTLANVDWLHVAGIGAVHVIALTAPFYYSRSGLLIALLGWVLVGLGVSVGYHRLLTHRAFKAPRWFVCLLTSFALAWQGSPVVWVAKHRRHHRYADRPGDPHSPIPSFLWGHIGWVLFKSDKSVADAKDLAGDPFFAHLHRLHAISNPLLALALYVIGERYGGLGASWVIWGVAVRTVFCHHAAWLVNSATHRVGYRNYATRDGSRNTFWVALLTFGEGWHNNHHAHPRSAMFGHRWWEIDVGFLVIRALQAVGIATDVQRPRDRIQGESDART